MKRQYLKHVYSITTDAVTTQVFMTYSGVTDNITIANKFYQSPGNTGSSRTNVSCASYLGVHVAERVLKNVFAHVDQMRYGNPGYDFVCGGGYKIDVKSACMRDKPRGNTWVFATGRNTTADYFLCLAFSDRDELVPMHLWLVPTDTLYDYSSISITVNNMCKWDKYRIGVKNVAKCCDQLR